MSDISISSTSSISVSNNKQEQDIINTDDYLAEASFLSDLSSSPELRSSSPISLSTGSDDELRPPGEDPDPKPELQVVFNRKKEDGKSRRSRISSSISLSRSRSRSRSRSKSKSRDRQKSRSNSTARSRARTRSRSGSNSEMNFDGKNWEDQTEAFLQNIGAPTGKHRNPPPNPFSKPPPNLFEYAAPGPSHTSGYPQNSLDRGHYGVDPHDTRRYSDRERSDNKRRDYRTPPRERRQRHASPERDRSPSRRRRRSRERHSRRRSGDDELFTRRRSITPPTDNAWLSLQEEMNATERLRYELEETRREIELRSRQDEEYERSRPTSRGGIWPPPPPHLSRDQMSPPRYDQPSTSSGQRFSDNWGREGFSTGVRESEWQPRRSRTPSESSVVLEEPAEETLKPGNYIIACWGVTETRTGEVYQIGAFLPHGVYFHKCIRPENLSEEDLMRQSDIFTKIGLHWYVKIEGKRLMMVSAETALTEFISFLEKGCQSVRPSYTGVLLLSHLQETIPTLLKMVRNADLQARFYKVVKGLGDLCSYLALCHMRKFVNMDLSLPAVHGIVMGLGMEFVKKADAMAEIIYRILEKLLEAKPNYNNFFAKFFLPVTSKQVQMMANFRGIAERTSLFLPLQNYIANELTAQQVELIVEGVYDPSEEDTDRYLTDPQKVAIAMCKMLVSAGFDFDQLLNLYIERGLPELELKLRMEFLRKMEGRERAVVDQTVKMTRLVVNFFREHGHLSLKDLLNRAKEQTLAPTENAQFTSNVGEKSSEQIQREYQTMFKSYSGVIEYINRRLQKKKLMPKADCNVEEIKIMVDMMINSLIQAKMNYEKLILVYFEDKGKFRTRNNFRTFMNKVLESSYRIHGPKEIRLTVFVDLLIDFLGNSVYVGTKSVPPPPSIGEPSTTSVPNPDLEEVKAELDRAINNQYRETDALYVDFKTRLTSLSALSVFFKSQFHDASNPDYIHSVSEHIQRLIAFLGYDFNAIISLGSKSVPLLADHLFSALKPKAKMLPIGIFPDEVVKWVVQFFKQHQKLFT